MTKPVHGFTLIEVTLVLAISGLILVGVLGSISYRVSTQRFNDTVNTSTEFLQSVYTEVTNVQNERSDVAFNQSYCSGPLQIARVGAAVIDSASNVHAGRSSCAIYGKLITFGENNNTAIHTYSIIGTDAVLDGNDSDITGVLGALAAVYADVYAFNYGADATQCMVSPAGDMDTFNAPWEGRIEDTGSTNLARGAVMIVRSPISGAVHTYRLRAGQTIEVAQHVNAAFACGYNNRNIVDHSINGVYQHILRGDFEAADFDVCINSPDLFAGGNVRRDLRILADGRTSAAIRLTEANDGDNRCV